MEVDEAFPSFGLIRFIIRDNPLLQSSYPGENHKYFKVHLHNCSDLKHKLLHLFLIATKKGLENSSPLSYSLELYVNWHT